MDTKSTKMTSADPTKSTKMTSTDPTKSTKMTSADSTKFTSSDATSKNGQNNAPAAVKTHEITIYEDDSEFTFDENDPEFIEFREALRLNLSEAASKKGQTKTHKITIDKEDPEFMAFYATVLEVREKVNKMTRAERDAEWPMWANTQDLSHSAEVALPFIMSELDLH